MSKLEYFEPVNKLPEYTFYTFKTKLYREIIQSFLDSDYKCVKLNLKLFDRTPARIHQCLGSFIKNHKFPIKIFRRNNELYLTKI